LILVALAAGIVVGQRVRLGKAPMRARPGKAAAPDASGDTYQHRVLGPLSAPSTPCGACS
jgi:hypothetical protein